MRAIQYRAWDKEKKILYPEENVQIGLGFGQGYLTRPEENGDNPEVIEIGTLDDRFELMQFTGMRDKKGVEIYEGDIVQINHIRAEIAWNVDECAFVIKYKSYSTEYGSHSPRINFHFSQLEVIGNIYQNPELLT